MRYKEFYSNKKQGVAEGSDGNFKSGDKVYHSGRKEIGTFLDYDDRNTTTNNNAWVDFDGEELMVSLDRLSKVQQGMAEGILDEVSSNWEERIKAQERIADLVQSRENWQDHPIDDINEMKKLVKIVGRATVIRDSDNYRKLGTAGKLLDLMTHYYNQKQIQSGTLPQFDSAVASSQYFARQIAMHTNGTYNHRYARVWTTGHGQRYKDPSDYVEYNSKDDLDSAWQWIESKGKKVYYYDHFKHLNEAVKIGKFIVEPASYTTRPFSDSPETVHAVSVRTAAVINKSVRRQVDISDQQANALKDIAATKNKNALEGIKLIMSILQGEQDVKSVIDNSKKLDSNVKAKLDAIITGAANFKEPDQGLSEGLPKKKLKEIDFSSSLGELSVSQEDLINNASNDGSIGSRKVYIFKSGPTKIYFFTDENKIAALVYLYQDRIMGMKNFSKNKGLIYNLFQYIINIKKQKVKLTPKDKLTPDGIKWIIDQIRRADGFKITDARGNKIDPNTLYDEWENSRLSGSNGPTEIVISESSNSKEIRDNESRLMPMDIFGATLKNIDENYPKRNTMTNILETDIMSGLISEKAKSKAQQRFFGMAHALQKGKKIPGASTELKQVAKSMGKKDVKDFAKTKHKNLPTHVKKG